MGQKVAATRQTKLHSLKRFDLIRLENYHVPTTNFATLMLKRMEIKKNASNKRVNIRPIQWNQSRLCEHLPIVSGFVPGQGQPLPWTKLVPPSMPQRCRRSQRTNCCGRLHRHWTPSSGSSAGCLMAFLLIACALYMYRVANSPNVRLSNPSLIQVETKQLHIAYMLSRQNSLLDLKPS